MATVRVCCCVMWAISCPRMKARPSSVSLSKISCGPTETRCESKPGCAPALSPLWGRARLHVRARSSCRHSLRYAAEAGARWRCGVGESCLADGSAPLWASAPAWSGNSDTIQMRRLSPAIMRLTKTRRTRVGQFASFVVQEQVVVSAQQGLEFRDAESWTVSTTRRCSSGDAGGNGTLVKVPGGAAVKTANKTIPDPSGCAAARREVNPSNAGAEFSSMFFRICHRPGDLPGSDQPSLAAGCPSFADLRLLS